MTVILRLVLVGFYESWSSAVIDASKSQLVSQLVFTSIPTDIVEKVLIFVSNLSELYQFYPYQSQLVVRFLI